MHSDKSELIHPTKSQELVTSEVVRKPLQSMEQAVPEIFDWPRWSVPQGIGQWISAIGYLMGVVGFIALFVPTVASFAVLAILLVLFSPLLVASALYMARLTHVAYRRLIQYKLLHGTLKQKDQTMDQLTRRLAHTETVLLSIGTALIDSQRIQIERVQLYQGVVYLILDPLLTEVQVGDLVIVIDTTDGVLFGTFEVNSVERGRCIAREKGNLDPVWAGEIHQAGHPETFPPPYSAAILYKEGQGA